MLYSLPVSLMAAIYQTDILPFLVQLGLGGAVYVFPVMGHWIVQAVLLLLRKVVNHWHRSQTWYQSGPTVIFRIHVVLDSKKLLFLA